jgi:SAM-dependent methyltransferase
VTDHAAQNREAWTKMSIDFSKTAPEQWASTEITWGIWNVKESALGALAGIEFKHKSTIELGCGTAYFSAWLQRLGAHPTGIDVTPAQLETARKMQAQFNQTFPLIEGSAEQVPLPDETFDFALSEYGASIWCDSTLWIPEAARLLKPGGHLVFLRNSTLNTLCMPDEGPSTDRLVRDTFGLNRIEWDGGVEFHLPTGEMIRLLRNSGFEIEDLIEIQAPTEAEESRFGYVTKDWARRWPSEEIWRVRMR